jgi:hypothetical protein
MARPRDGRGTLPAGRLDTFGSAMDSEEELRPKRADAGWTWPKIAILIASLLAMATLLLFDFEH